MTLGVVPRTFEFEPQEKETSNIFPFSNTSTPVSSLIGGSPSLELAPSRAQGVEVEVEAEVMIPQNVRREPS